ncbi:hypothetical protein [Yersinia enterocolitica]|uniref:hypothetical protein n=1 Tax=Yersinia enterocolitica TaxID=630 RepID=UPI003F44420C
MNNIEQIIVRLKTRVALAELIGPDVTVSASDLSALIAQLEAAQKESAIRLEAIEQMRKTVAHNVERAQTAEAALSAENEKLNKPVVLPSATYVRIGYGSTSKRTLYLDEVITAIKAAGFTVEGE